MAQNLSPHDGEVSRVGGSRGGKSLRNAVLSLRRAQDTASRNGAEASLKAALLTAAASNEAVEGALLGMAAAQASKFGMKNLLAALCAFAWNRLEQYGGREVAELTSATAKAGCTDARYFSFVVLYCFNCPNSFVCLRDVALMATSIQLRATEAINSGPLDVAIAFHGLATAALPWLDAGAKSSPRDIVEFFGALARALHRTPLDGGPSLCTMPVPIQACSAAAFLVRPLLHKASAQDLAKVADAAATCWSLIPPLQDHVLQPLLQELAQAVRFRGKELNSQDIAMTAVAFAKVDVLDQLAAGALGEQVVARLPTVSAKELCLLLWAATRPVWAGGQYRAAAAGEVGKRDLANFSTQDICMAAQALAKLGEIGKAPICIVAGEAFARQLRGFSTTDKAMLLWALAKSKALHIALCHLLVRDLVMEQTASLSRDVVSAALWSLAVVWPSLTCRETWPELLAAALAAAEPWRGAYSYEVANALWAFGQLPLKLHVTTWSSLLQACAELVPSQLSLHEICNMIAGLSVCPQEVATGERLLEAFATEVVRRNDAGHELMPHDRRSLVGGWTRRERCRVAAGFDKQYEPAVVQSLWALAKRGPPKADARGDETPRRSHKGRDPESSGSTAAPHEESPSGECAAKDSSRGDRFDEAVAHVSEPRDSPPMRCFKGELSGSFGHGFGHGHGHGHHGHDHGHTHRESPLDATYEGTDDISKPSELKKSPHLVKAAAPHGPGCCTEICCPEVNVAVGQDNLLRLNAHCNYGGHCIQLKHTFIHIECPNQSDDSDEDCMLCHLSRRRRARSSDNLEVVSSRNEASGV